ncbi:MAG: hypothetical protein HRT74_11885 [Flavobacteriales bacterium]|nr:hypothetical protein [Flavobacteriales bacterium]
MPLRALWIIFFLLLSRWVLASSADPTPLGFEETVDLPLIRAGKLLLIEAEVDGVKGNFIFDTGAPYLVLNETYFRNVVKLDSVKAS